MWNIVVNYISVEHVQEVRTKMYNTRSSHTVCRGETHWENVCARERMVTLKNISKTQHRIAHRAFFI